MSEKLTQDDSDRLADILWWIKGFRAGVDSASGGFSSPPFGTQHEATIIKIRNFIRETLRADPDADGGAA